MTFNRTVVVAVVLALLAGLWGGFTLARLGGSARTEGAEERQRSAKAGRAGEPIAGDLRFLNARIETEGERPRACLEFSKDLAADGSVRFADFVRMEPAAQAEFTAAGKLLCISGLPFEPDRQVTLLSGLPAQDGSKLPVEETFTLSFGERPAFVGFAGNGVILPRSEADGLGIETVNVSRLKIEVLRISDRNVARESIEAGESVPEGSWSYWNFEYAGQDLGAPVYKGEIAVDLGKAGTLESKRNVGVTTVFPLGAALKRVQPGAYVVKVEDASPGAGASGERDRPAAAYRTVIYTDLALQTFKGADGMDVMVRSLASAKPQKDVALVLVAQNNDELARVKTDAQGRARFDAALLRGEGALRPRAVLAYGRRADFTALDLERSPIDLSEKDVGGRSTPPQIDAYFYTDRGIYRPGETVRLSGLLRDLRGRAVSDRKSVLVVRRPNGTEAMRQRLAAAVEAGALLQYIPIRRGAPRGRWVASLLVDGQDEPAGEIGFLVEDFVPQKLKVEVRLPETAWDGAGVRSVPVQANFLYGAVGAGLPVQGELRLTRDPDPFPEFKGYQFGLAGDNFQDQFVSLDETVTDGGGAASLALRLDSKPDTSLPLRAYVNAAVLEPGGRAVREGGAIPVRPARRYLGLKAAFESFAAEGAPVGFDLVALDRAGRRVAEPQVSWSLIEEDYGYDWYLENGQWRWRRTGRDIPRNGAAFAIGADKPARLDLGALKGGSYRLEVSAGDAKSSYRFGVGWGGGATDRDTPDVVAVATPGEPAKPGARVRVDIKSPYPGEAQIVVATDRVLSTRTVRVGAKPASVDLTADASWGPGAYVLVTVVTPRDPKTTPTPRRALGVAYVPVDLTARTLQVSLAPQLEKLRPLDAVKVPIEVSGAKGGKVRVTLAEVDEGVLQLTKFASPDPAKHFYGRRALGVELRDDYGRLLNPNLAAPSTPSQGGDGLAGEGLSVVPQKTVALWSGLVALKNGKGEITLPAADFNGALRLMAVVWTEDAVGSAERKVVVRDPVVADVTLPRFLAPGDDAQATLLLDNVEGMAGEYVATLKGEGAARLEGAAFRVRLASGEQKVLRAPIGATRVGIGRVALTLEGPNGFKVERAYPIEARAPFLPLTLVDTEAQPANAVWTATPALFAPFAAGSGEAVVSYSALRGVDAAALLGALERYPYGCSEQIVSVAMPLLHAEALKAANRTPADAGVRKRLQDAVSTLLDRQSADGAIGLWRAGDEAASPWLGAYAADFLVRARAAGLIVPQGGLDKTLDALRAVARLDDFAPVAYDFAVYRWPGSNDSEELLRSRSAAYALYVLAKAGKASLGQLRYFADAKLKAEPSPLAKAQIAAGLAHLGDRTRALRAFAEAEKALGYENTGDWYQTPLRDVAGVLALAAEAGQDELAARLARRLERQSRDPEALSTQEQAAVLAAANAMLKRAGPVAVSVSGGAAQAAPTRLTPGAVEGKSFRNVAQGQLFRTVTRTGAPAGPPPAAAAGFQIEKRFFRMNGAAVDPESLRQGERIVVVLQGKPEAARTHPALLVDLLPAGLEIETVLRPDDGVTLSGYDGATRAGAFGWVGMITPARVAEARDDRFVAAADMRDAADFTFAYVARAVSPGSYALPGAQVEDMYRPGVFGRSAAGRLVIAAPPG